MSWFGTLGRFSASPENYEMPEIYPLAFASKDFVRADVLATYTKILTDASERMHGLKDELWRNLWDSCVQSQASKGLISLLAEAMYEKADLFLVFKSGILRVATEEERQKIEADYKSSAKSSVGAYISFNNYRRTDLLKILSEMEYCVIASLYKGVNLAKAVQIRMSELRASTALSDRPVIVSQARTIAEGLRAGRDVLLDSGDQVTTTTPDISPVKQAIEFLDGKRSYHLNLPLAYISGIQTGGIGSTGDADARAIDRGLKNYFVSIIQPAVEEVFGVTVEFRPEDGRQIEAGVEVLKAFELVSDTYLSAETKRDLVARAFDIDPVEEKKRLDKEAADRKQKHESETESPFDGGGDEE